MHVGKDKTRDLRARVRIKGVAENEDASALIQLAGEGWKGTEVSLIRLAYTDWLDYHAYKRVTQMKFHHQKFSKWKTVQGSCNCQPWDT